MTTPEQAPTPGLGLDAQKLCVLSLMALLVGVAAAAGLPFVGAAPLLPDLSVPWWALACAYVVTEMFVLHIQVRREAHTLSLVELPLVIGLFFASPLDLLLGRLLASLISHGLLKRARPLK